MKAVMQSTGIWSLIDVWSIPVFFALDKSSSVWCFLPAWRTTSNANSNKRSPQCGNWPVESDKFITYLIASWPMHRANREASKLGESSNIYQTTARHLHRVVLYAYSASFNELDHILLVCWFRQATFSEGQMQSACCKRLYLLYRQLANMEEPTWGIPVVLPEGSPKRLFHRGLVRNRSVTDLSVAFCLMERRFERGLVWSAWIRCTSKKWIEVPRLSLGIRVCVWVNRACW